MAGNKIRRRQSGKNVYAGLFAVYIGMGGSIYLFPYLKYAHGPRLANYCPAVCSAATVYNIQDGPAVDVLFKPDGIVSGVKILMQACAVIKLCLAI